MLVTVSWGPVAVPAHAQSDTRFAAIDAYVLRALRQDRVPGAAWAIVRGDSVVHVGAVGEDGNGRPITHETPFVLGSMSKPFTALAVMQLVEQGRLGLDAPVQRYLPWFRVADSTASRLITVRQLLLHTSGLPTHAARATADGRTVAAHVRALRDVALANTPGATHEYSSPNYLVLGALVEAVTETSFATHLQRAIIEPLGLKHTFVTIEAARADGLATGHRYWFGFPIGSALPHEPDRLPTAAILSSAGDLAKFLIAQRLDTTGMARPIVTSSSLAAMQTGGVHAETFSYGFGWRISQLNGTRAVHHGGIVPDYRGKMIMLPDAGWSVVVLTNASSTLPLPLPPTSHRIADAVAARLVGAPLEDPRSGFRLVHWALLGIALLVVFSQLRGLWRLRADNTSTDDRRRRLSSIAVESLWVVGVAVFLPRLMGITWAEMLHGSPDLGWWLVVTLVLSVATVVVRARGLQTQRSD